MSDDPAQTARPETSLNARPELRSGVAPIRAEFLVDPTPTVESTSTSALNAQGSHPYADADDAAEGSVSTDARDSKRRKVDKKSRKGQNKARTFTVMRDAGERICRAWELGGTCPKGGEAGGCKWKHTWEGYFDHKPVDLRFEPRGKLSTDRVGGGEGEEGGFVVLGERTGGGELDEVGKTLDLGTTCPVREELGYCTFGWRCRFLGGHIRRLGDEAEGNEKAAGAQRVYNGWELVGDEQVDSKKGWKDRETNWADFETLGILKSNSYRFPFSERYLAQIEPDKPFTLYRPRQNRPQKKPKPANEEDLLNAEEAAIAAADAAEAEMTGANAEEQGQNGHVQGESEAIDVPLRPEEKRRLNWEDGLYLAPLTTVGNLPFRRLCITYGASITCSEMALAQSLVSGQNEEWALMRRHESEKMFGVQVAGGYANRMVPCAEMIAKELGPQGVDFVDVNLGCPIDLVFNQGAGSALMDSPGRLGKILVGMNRALGEIPLSVKFRTGVANGRPNAHKLVPRFAREWGAGAMTLHGRSRQQRYSKLADWAYIRECSTVLRETMADAGLPPIPIFGNGDCFSAQSYWEEKTKSGVDGVMVARGALIKPWIFTEIKEKREWDISAVERLEGVRKYAEFGLTHWGSDTAGVSKTRRFLCEALSFQHRYIPIGLLERLPPMLNDRPPAYKGRSELETLLSSPYVGDWIKISEMFLGKAEEGWSYTPKHKSNAYGAEEAQG